MFLITFLSKFPSGSGHCTVHFHNYGALLSDHLTLATTAKHEIIEHTHVEEILILRLMSLAKFYTIFSNKFIRVNMFTK